MSQTSPPTITGSPTAPQRSDRATFSGRVDAFVTWMAAAVSEFGAVATNVYDNAVDAYNNAVAASSSASTASSAAASAIATAGATQWVSGTTYALGDAVWSPIDAQTYRRIVAGAGSTDPSADPTNWAKLGGASLSVVTVSGTTQTATAGNHYVLTNVAATTVTLPASAASGDSVAITPANSLTTNVIGRGGYTIMGLAEDMTLDNANATVTLRYLANTWRII